MNTVLLQAAGGAGYGQLIMMVGLVVVFYFFMIRPQMKKQKDHKKYIEQLGVNSKVVTTAGIHGRIVEVSDTTFLVDVGSGVKIRFDKSAIALDASKAANNTEKSAS
ncbi:MULTISPECIES: preprotein translocase subunit YajC [Sphingobacterium]|jgi:preprotein translocase subunit YajC|uniref:Sec translocon accessory complex subunit YajC n=2 Tax=Sphingobacterium TaxID=28453 RepID=A0ABX7CVB1_SPHMU|nr:MULTISPECIES: preprotein translocase subunit YajC [Sphingobacterium]MCS4163287.1 preprotein translocase subunit YajC [Sphingobacterium sp. BIGb0116]QQT28967.1 preprotein translocase subunit YajC [Sphingobacterium multivorum]QQT55004.1 preprotein translocase subunit YajC [Sphingobacterium multivorum]TWI24970.1 preprotein translocase subunit YajC [Sphingobacterium siyangense]